MSYYSINYEKCYYFYFDKGEFTHQLKNSDLTVIANYLDPETIKALSNFLRSTTFGNFTLIIQENKVVGYDFPVKKRPKK